MSEHQTRIKTVRKRLASGAVASYHYDRVTGQRLLSTPGTPEFAAELDGILSALPQPGTVGSLLAAYYDSPEWSALADATKRIYRRGHAHLESFARLPVAELRKATITGVRKDLRATPGLANQFLTATSALIEWALETEDDEWAGLECNPVRSVKRAEGGAWKRWPEEALKAFEAADLPRDVRLGFALMLYTGQRRGDCLRMRWDDIGETIRVVAQKTARNDEDILWVPVHPSLRSLLDAERAHTKGLHVVHADDGRPYWDPDWATCQRRQGLFWERLNRAQKRVLGEAYPPHGLRKSAAARLAEAGCTTHEIMSVTGHRSMRQVEHYTRQAERARSAREAMRKVVG